MRAVPPRDVTGDNNSDLYSPKRRRKEKGEKGEKKEKRKRKEREGQQELSWINRDCD